MTNKINQLFPRKDSYAGSGVTNEAGSPAFHRSLEEQAVQVLMVGNLEDTFYTGAQSLTSTAIDTLTKMATKDPEFLAKAIVYARNRGYMRLTPIVALLVLSKESPKLFRQIFKSVIRQPGDLQDFMTLVRSKSVRSTGGCVRDAVGEWMNSISDYHVVKYGAPQKKAGAGSPVNLRDVLRLAHTRPTKAMEPVFAYIVKRIKGEAIDAKLLRKLPEGIRDYEKFKDLTAGTVTDADVKKALKLVQGGSLPYEVVTARLNTPEAWKALAINAPFMNMLRNLNNYEKYGVFKDEKVVDMVIERLTNAEKVAKSKQFPFRFYSAYRMFSGHQDVRTALVDALDLSLSNLPELGSTLVAVDESGSMDHPVSERSTVTMREIGNLFAAAIWKKSSRSYLVPFTTVAYPVGHVTEADKDRIRRQHDSHHGYGYNQYVTNAFKALGSINRKDSTVTIAEALKGVNGGTALSAPLKWALAEGRSFDTGVFITDSESWADHLRSGTGVLDEIRKFRKKNPKAQFFFIQLAPNQAVQVPPTEPGCHFIYGWSPVVLKYIAQVVAGGKSQVDEIRGWKLQNEAVEDELEDLE